jgi:hypothetical protein
VHDVTNGSEMSNYTQLRMQRFKVHKLTTAVVKLGAHGVQVLNHSYNTYILLTLYPRWGSRDVSDIHDTHILPNDLIVRNTVDMTGGKPITV